MMKGKTMTIASILATLESARSFIEGFEGDELQDGLPEELLAKIDAAMASRRFPKRRLPLSRDSLPLSAFREAMELQRLAAPRRHVKGNEYDESGIYRNGNRGSQGALSVGK
jgi:hypothetical protein